MTAARAAGLRWDDYVLGRDDASGGATAQELVVAASAEAGGGGALYVLGLGFDPRALHGIRALLPVLPAPARVLALTLGRSRGVGRAQDLQKAHRTELAALCEQHGAVLAEHPYPTIEDRRRAGVRIVRDLAPGSWDAPHVVIDVSALPSTVFYALTASYLRRPTGPDGRQLQLVVTENPGTDDLIVQEGAQSPIAVPGFDGGLDLQAVEPPPRVWAPVLGIGQQPQLEMIMTTLEPDEVCPVLPFPARNPRRGDDLLREHHRLLFGTFGVEPRNFIYADERNPFDLYRTLSALQSRYRDALGPLGPAVVVPSTHSSKLLSVGVMLAAYEHSLPVMSASASSRLRPEVTDDEIESLGTGDQLTCLWLDGAPYA